MLSKEENELLCCTGPGTPMGGLFRRFWLPVALSRELPKPDCMDGCLRRSRSAHVRVGRQSAERLSYRSREATQRKLYDMRGIREEDIAIQENLYGPIVDRTKEHLGISDAGVIALRHRLLKKARDRQAGQKPSEPHCGGAYRVHPTGSLVRRGISFNEVARSAMPIRLDA